MNTLRSGAAGLVVGLVIGGLGCLWVANRAPQAIPGALPPALVGKVATPEVRTVYVYRDAKVPKGVAPGSQVVSGAVFKKGGVVTGVIDTEGRVGLVMEEAKLPWLAKNNEWHGSLYAGYLGNDFIYRGTAERHLYQVKGAYVGLVVAADKHPDETKVFIGVGVRF